MARTLRQSILFLLLCSLGVGLAGGGFVSGYSVGYMAGEWEARQRYLQFKQVPEGDFHPLDIGPAK